LEFQENALSDFCPKLSQMTRQYSGSDFLMLYIPEDRVCVLSGQSSKAFCGLRAAEPSGVRHENVVLPEITILR
jgi:hypothetical protein